MYKKIAVLSLVLSTFMQYGCDATTWLEFKPSYFFFTSSPMKDVYNKGGFEIQASASVPVYKWLDLYGDFGYRRVKGHALSTCDTTTLSLIPIDIGLKPVFNFCERFYYYFAFGPRFFCYQQNNCSQYVEPTINGGGAGFFVNTGLNVLLRDHFLFHEPENPSLLKLGMKARQLWTLRK